ncbi:hypothetical protein HDU92_003666 [Lobulomyces angularis]|nr:hypothetical protein HDU92_003666 [Lobulomyces angularis]
MSICKFSVTLLPAGKEIRSLILKKKNLKRKNINQQIHSPNNSTSTDTNNMCNAEINKQKTNINSLDRSLLEVSEIEEKQNNAIPNPSKLNDSKITKDSSVLELAAKEKLVIETKTDPFVENLKKLASEEVEVKNVSGEETEQDILEKLDILRAKKRKLFASLMKIKGKKSQTKNL